MLHIALVRSIYSAEEEDSMSVRCLNTCQDFFHPMIVHMPHTMSLCDSLERVFERNGPGWVAEEDLLIPGTLSFEHLV